MVAYYCFLGFALIGCTPSIDDGKALDNEEDLQVLEQKNTVVFPMISMQSDLSSLNFFNRTTRSIEQVIESRTPQQFIDVHVVDDRIFVLKEDVRANSPPLLQILNMQGEIQQENELLQAHHTIAPVAAGVAYLGQELVRQDNIELVIDMIYMYDLSTQERQPLLDIRHFCHPESFEIFFSQEGQNWDLTHANTLRWNERRGLFIVTFAGINAIWEFTSDGVVQAVYLGEGAGEQPYFSTDVYSGGQFHHPHGATIDDSGVLWVLSTVDQVSEVQGYEIHDGNLQLISQVPPPDPTFQSLAGGNVLKIDESIVVNWGFSGVIEERNTNGQEIWQFNAPLGFGIGFATLAP